MHATKNIPKYAHAMCRSDPKSFLNEGFVSGEPLPFPPMVNPRPCFPTNVSTVGCLWWTRHRFYVHRRILRAMKGTCESLNLGPMMSDYTGAGACTTGTTGYSVHNNNLIYLLGSPSTQSLIGN